jgi:hypothetical protein
MIASLKNCNVHVEHITRHFMDVICQCFTSPFAFTASKTFLVLDVAVFGRNLILKNNNLIRFLTRILRSPLENYSIKL